jgi:hypothetical protein
VRQTGSGPASGNGNSSKTAESAAAAHSFHTFDFKGERTIQGRVYNRAELVRARGWMPDVIPSLQK